MMTTDISQFNGLHPGAVLKWILKKRGIKPIELACAIEEHKQTISAILHEKRGINARLSVKLAELLALDPAFFMQLQASFEIKQVLIEKQPTLTPNLSIIRKVLFWDTNFEQIDWQKQKTAVIKRIFERGNEQEIKEVIRFYGKETVQNVLSRYNNSFLTAYNENKQAFLKNNKNVSL